MATTKAQIKEWYDNAVSLGAVNMLVVCDTFDYDDYPVYIMTNEEVKDTVAKYNGVNMQRIMEIYDMNLPFDEQRASRPDLMNRIGL